MQPQVIALIVGGLFGLGAGVFTARASQQREPIYGGGAAVAMHYFTASISTATPVMTILCLITGGFLYAVSVALSLLILSYASATVFATLERPAREGALSQKIAQGWTEEDARTSGL